MGPLSFGWTLFASPFGLSPAATATLAGTLWLATWWVTEAIPIPATSLLPVVLFPTTGVTGVAKTTAPYADPVVFLLLGGFLLAVGIERWGVHRRVALTVVTAVGLQSDRLLLGIMVSTALLSMWVSNSATAMLMLPVGAAVTAALDPDATWRPDEIPPDETPLDGDALGASASGEDHVSTGAVDGTVGAKRSPQTRFGLATMLGIAYAASIGGVATPVGSPPNAVFVGVVGSQLGIEVTFLDWLSFAGPLAAVFLLVSWGLLTALLRPTLPDGVGTEVVLRRRREALGPPSRGERRVLAVVAVVAAGWLLRPVLVAPVVPGASDAVVAIAGGVALFVVPAGDGERRRLLTWTDAARLPWGVLLLLGGGLSLANAMQTSGLDTAVARALAGLGTLPVVGLVAAFAAVVVFLTEVTSNTATAAVFVPIAITLGPSLGVPPVTLAATVALAASFAFMLPVATPPNAVVFASGYVTAGQMSRVGFWLNLLAIAALVATTYLWLPIALAPP
ncbi:SLC13 family permease [Halobaculum sp. MBLA0147]|uniref:SLC13 family permease n=1 Tax=Halobaculum sp. MBLA0147 TaxID=3079934 RepID=UPI0035239745